MAKAKAKNKGKKKGRQAKLSKGKKKGRAKVATKARKGAKKKKAAKRKVVSKPRIMRVEPAPAQSFTEISEEITPSVPETPEEPVIGSTESTVTGNDGFTSTDDSNNMSM